MLLLTAVGTLSVPAVCGKNSTVEKYKSEAKYYCDQLEHKKAADVLTKALLLAPNDLELLERRSDAYAQIFIMDKAEADLSKAISINPKNAGFYRHRARLYFRDGKLQKAVADYDTAVKLDPKDLAPYRDRGRIHEQLGNGKKAVEDFQKFIDSGGNDNNGEVLQHLGDLYLKDGQTQRALETFNRMIKYVPDLSGGYYGRARVYEKLGKFDLAKSDKKQGKKLDLAF